MKTTARAILFDLIVDVEQLITAGAECAQGHERLSQHAQRLEKLSLQVPALHRFLPLLHRVISAERHQIAHELLNLVMHTRKLRASIAETNDLEGELQPATESTDWSTDTPVKELIPQVGQMSRSRPYRCAVKHGSVSFPERDIRMVGRIVKWIENGNANFAHSVIEDVLPRFGSDMGPELARKGFDPAEIGDLNRLVALAKVDATLALESIGELDPELHAYLNTEPQKPKKTKPKKKEAADQKRN
jgi:hypothetical protein